MSYSRALLSIGCVQKMTKLLLIIGVFGMQICNSSEMPPRIQSCRQFHKAKPVDLDNSESYTEVFNFSAGEACVSQVTLQNIDDAIVNFTDPRNCQNFYKCQGLSCWQCPCPGDQTFNPNTLKCDSTRAVCACKSKPKVETTTIITGITISQIVPEQTTRKEKVIAPPAAPNGNDQKTNDSTNGVVIIAVIVVATVLILLALVIGFCLWQRGIFPLNKKPSMHPSSNDGYLHTLPPQERHVYAEIDERTVGLDQQNNRHISGEEAGRQLQHMYAPPIPSHHPPPTCIHHPHETFVLPPGHQPRLYPQFSGYPIPMQAQSMNKDLIRFSASSAESKSNFSQNNNHTSPNVTCDYSNTDNGSETSCSGCSHCSALSSQHQLEHQEAIDRRTLLHYDHRLPPHTQFNFVSKQVYI